MKTKKAASTPYHPQDATVHAAVLTLYRADLSRLTEAQRSDLHNAAGAYLARLKKFHGEERAASDRVGGRK